MGNPALIYDGNTIDLGKMPRAYQAVKGPPRRVRQSVGGVNEIVTEPRVVNVIQAQWLIEDSATLYRQLENWWQWAQRGESFAFAMDSAKVVDTKVSISASKAATTLWVNSPTGIAAGSYRILDGPNHQTVTVASVEGDKVTLSSGLAWAVGVDAIFRDEFYFPGYMPEDVDEPLQVVDPDEKSPWPPARFTFDLRLREDVSQESDMLLKILAANENGGDVNTAQDWFPSLGDVSVAANTTYIFEGELRISRSAGTTSHTTGILFGGTATLTGIRYKANCNTGDTVANIAENGISGEVATLIVLKAASTSASEQISIRVTGVVRINAAGTFVPQFQYSAAPGGAPSVLSGSFFKMVPVGSGSFASQGTWA